MPHRIAQQSLTTPNVTTASQFAAAALESAAATQDDLSCCTRTSGEAEAAALSSVRQPLWCAQSMPIHRCSSGSAASLFQPAAQRLTHAVTQTEE